MSEKDLLYYNPANYVVDVIGEGRAATMGSMAAAIPAQQSMWRQLSPAEVTLITYTYACTNAADRAPTQRNATETVTDYTCFGMRFLRVIRGGNALYFVANHPGVIRPTGLQGAPKMNASPTAHWPYAPSRAPRGIGQVVANPQNRDEITAANTLLDYLNTNGCTKSPFTACSSFQTAYNASGLPGQLTPDGEYGPNTERALQNVLNEAQNDAGAGPAEQAPANCFPEYGQVPAVPALDVTPSSPSPSPAPPVLPTTVVTGNATGSNKGALIVGATAAAVAGGLGYWYYRRHKRGR